jgi:hypothetical protein
MEEEIKMEKIWNMENTDNRQIQRCPKPPWYSPSIFSLRLDYNFPA